MRRWKHFCRLWEDQDINGYISTLNFPTIPVFIAFKSRAYPEDHIEVTIGMLVIDIQTPTFASW
jgi:hypothetical protein